ncbi:MAG: hypothetical protein H0U95_09180 [Bacteroidetes bacterium]|nr:hypothetical protein [Bacteroidota bacterium]
MAEELTNLTQKEQEQPVKTPNSTFKMTKAEDTIVKIIKFYSHSNFLYIINTSFEAKLNKGELNVLFKPPTC